MNTPTRDKTDALVALAEIESLLGPMVRSDFDQNNPVHAALEIAVSVLNITPAAVAGEGEGALVLPAGWYTFVNDCALTAGGMVNGNQLSAKAKALIDNLAFVRE